MSRIGRKPITIPSGVTFEVVESTIKVNGSKGNLETPLLSGLAIDYTDGIVTVSKAIETPTTQATFGLQRTLIANMVEGVSKGYERKLEINGVGYRAAVSGSTITLALGFSHPVIFELPTGIQAAVEKNIITVTGYDKQAVGQVAANLRALKKPEPYKGKGIKYVEETIRRKAGKTATKG